MGSHEYIPVGGEQQPLREQAGTMLIAGHPVYHPPDTVQPFGKVTGPGMQRDAPQLFQREVDTADDRPFPVRCQVRAVLPDETPQETAGGLEQKVDELNRRLEEAEAENRRAESRERMMEQSYRMAARYLNPNPEGSPGEAKEEEKPEPVPVSRAESGTTSALEQPLTDSAFVASLAVERNYGFNTAVGSSYRMGMNTIPACISENQTLEQGGRVKLRLLEPLQAGSVTIPANSLVTGTADIRGERLDILVSSIEYAGNIIPVELATYDIDGQRGIFVPGSESRTAAKEVLGDMSQGMGGSISFAGSAGQQMAMDLTRGVLQGGTRFISQRVKAVKVKLKAGYKVLLVTKKQ